MRGAFEAGKTKNSLSVGYQSSDGYISHSDYQLYNMLWQTRMRLPEKAYIDLQLGYNNKRYGANTFYAATYPNQYERTSTYLKLNYELRKFNFYLNLNNLYDTHYYDIGNVPQAGFWLMGGVSYRL